MHVRRFPLYVGVVAIVAVIAFVVANAVQLFGDSLRDWIVQMYNADPLRFIVASILAETGVRLVPVRRANMRSHAWFMDDIELRAHRRGIEMTNGQQSTGEDGRWTLDGRRHCRV